MGTTVSSALVREWVHRAWEALGDERAEIDALNVFPVPDGDTGTNLFLTFEAAWESVEACWGPGGDAPPDLDAVARALSSGALMGARGNSGVIMSQILRGTSEVLGGLLDGSELSGTAVRDLLRRAADLSYQAVARPMEGTILTVARAAADAAQARVEAGVLDASEVVSAAAVGAREALDRTPDMLEALRLAGVVDAGGRGLVVVLDALAESVTGVRRSTPAAREDRRTEGADAGTERPPATLEHPAGYGGPAYEVMFLLDAPAVDELRAELDRLGDSLVVVGGEGLWNVHVHVDDAGAAIEAAMRAGRPYRIRVTYLETVVDRDLRTAERAIVAVAHGPGVAELLEGLGVTIVPAVPRRRPSTAELLGAIHQSHAQEVVVLPSDKDTRAVAEAAAEQARVDGVRVSVIPTRAIVQTLAAVAVHDPAARFDDDVVAMTRAAGATRYGAVTIASRQALTTAGACEAGDVLGLVDGDIVLVGAQVEATIRDLLSGMLAIGGELVTLVWGVEADQGLRDGVSAWIEERFPLVEIATFDGGQPLWPLIVGVE